MTVHATITEPTVALSGASEAVMIHVRFWPSAEIFTIDGKPDNLSPREWYNKLYLGYTQYYQTRANGRGFFRLPRPVFNALMSDIAA
ncbi:hypothetical protein [Xanthobacter agilis]|jgi:hypothetical protein|uniref:Uncharacterized protein n=1 Tax=Xanthobacter agilis TaxID=47492 RepID=A0ABU0LC11_XANAG|nr:hypothetical protein [Xanthobacter agilis]MDQ0504668.1 hypothetical protein [Xanthobacter agilis]